MEFVLGNIKIFGPNNSINQLWDIISNETNLVDENSLNFDGIVNCSCPVHSKNKEMITNLIIEMKNASQRKILVMKYYQEGIVVMKNAQKCLKTVTNV